MAVTEEGVRLRTGRRRSTDFRSHTCPKELALTHRKNSSIYRVTKQKKKQKEEAFHRCKYLVVKLIYLSERLATPVTDMIVTMATAWRLLPERMVTMVTRRC